MELRRQWRLRLLVGRGGCSGAGPGVAAGRSCGHAAWHKGLMLLLAADLRMADRAASTAVASCVVAASCAAEGCRLWLLSGPQRRLRWRNGRSHAVPREEAAVSHSIGRVNVAVGVCSERRADEGKGNGKGKD